MEILNNKDQAEHNFQVANYLGKKDTYSDWTITVSFYSALHYIRHLILPYTDPMGNVYTAFEGLWASLKASSEGRHGFQLRFVRDNYPVLDFEYKRLHEMSCYARYDNYKYDRDDAKRAKGYLLTIKEYVESRKN